VKYFTRLPHLTELACLCRSYPLITCSLTRVKYFTTLAAMQKTDVLVLERTICATLAATRQNGAVVLARADPMILAAPALATLRATRYDPSSVPRDDPRDRRPINLLPCSARLRSPSAQSRTIPCGLPRILPHLPDSELIPARPFSGIPARSRAASIHLLSPFRSLNSPVRGPPRRVG
jgi:hypothetical protein